MLSAMNSVTPVSRRMSYNTNLAVRIQMDFYTFVKTIKEHRKIIFLEFFWITYYLTSERTYFSVKVTR